MNHEVSQLTFTLKHKYLFWALTHTPWADQKLIRGSSKSLKTYYKKVPSALLFIHTIICKMVVGFFVKVSDKYSVLANFHLFICVEIHA